MLRRSLPGTRAVRRDDAQVHHGVLGRMGSRGFPSVLGERVATTRWGCPLANRSMTTERGAYRAAGVDVDAGDRAVELMRAAVESTRRPEVIGGLGGFAAAVGLPGGYREPVLVSSTDGVGTKTAIAGALRRFDTIGRDLVAMCADDVVCNGAAPLFFLDYIAVGR